MTVSGSKITSSGGLALCTGGAFDNYGILSISDSTLSGNSTSYRGGAIFNRNSATLSIANSIISGNSSNAGVLFLHIAVLRSQVLLFQVIPQVIVAVRLPRLFHVMPSFPIRPFPIILLVTKVAASVTKVVLTGRLPIPPFLEIRQATKGVVFKPIRPSHFLFQQFQGIPQGG